MIIVDDPYPDAQPQEGEHGGDEDCDDAEARSRGRPSHDRSTRNVPASGTVVSRDERHAPYRPRRRRSTVTVPTRAPASSGPVDLVGRVRAPPDALAVAQGEHALRGAERVGRCSSRYSTSAWATVRRGSSTRTRWKRPSPQRSSASVSASRAASLGSPSTTLITRAPPAAVARRRRARSRRSPCGPSSRRHPRVVGR